jgi:hypothetical protein
MLPKVQHHRDNRLRDRRKTEHTPRGDECTYCGEYLVAHTGTTMADHQMHIACYYELKAEMLNG